MSCRRVVPFSRTTTCSSKPQISDVCSSTTCVLLSLQHYALCFLFKSLLVAFHTTSSSIERDVHGQSKQVELQTRLHHPHTCLTLAGLVSAVQIDCGGTFGHHNPFTTVDCLRLIAQPFSRVARPPFFSPLSSNLSFHSNVPSHPQANLRAQPPDRLFRTFDKAACLNPQPRTTTSTTAPARTYGDFVVRCSLRSPLCPISSYSLLSKTSTVPRRPLRNYLRCTARRTSRCALTRRQSARTASSPTPQSFPSRAVGTVLPSA